MSYDEERARAQARYLRGLGPDAEVFGLIGQGFRKSLYKCFTRRTQRSAWHVFDLGHQRPISYDPIAAHARMVEKGGPGVVKAARVPLSDLGKFTFMPEKQSLRALWTRASEL